MTDTSQDENVAYYDSFASDYALFFHNLDENMDEEGDWLDHELCSRGAHRVLDASCGTGRQAIPLAERGYAVCGADPSDSMLAQAKRIATERNTSLELIQARFDQLPDLVDGDFDAVIALGNGLCNLTDQEQISVALRALRAVCRAGGVCYIGIKNFSEVQARGERFQGHTVIDDGPKRTILFEIWDIEAPHLVVHAFIVEGNRVHESWSTRTARTREYMLDEYELACLAEGAGFTAVRAVPHPSEAVFCLETAGSPAPETRQSDG